MNVDRDSLDAISPSSSSYIRIFSAPKAASVAVSDGPRFLKYALTRVRSSIS